MMEMSPGNSLCSYLKKIYIYIYFLFYKTGEQESGTGPALRVGTRGRGEEVGKGCKRENMVQILCTHVCKWKNNTY
jgi:hypothetical protein